MSDKKILFISDQIAPFTSQSDMAEYCRPLLQFTQNRGNEIRAFMPKWGSINERRNQLHEVIRLSGMNLIIDDTDHPLIIKVASLPGAKIQVYFIDNDDYFQNRLMVHDRDGAEYQDNDERAIFFARGVLETVKKLRWSPDIIHCHGWLSAFIPLYVKTGYREEPAFRESKIVYSLYDKAFDNSMRDNLPQLLPAKDMQVSDCGTFETPIGFSSLMKKAIDFSDGIICQTAGVDPGLAQYAREKNLPVLDFNPDGMEAQATNDFYDKL
ncbi:MAG: glycogen/starch synthase [Bacteroidaceae bacterium]|nr:glycogen/starch synthase [Bacteroidaceae bacterium]